jgi:hypothetical protein
VRLGWRYRLVDALTLAGGRCVPSNGNWWTRWQFGLGAAESAGKLVTERAKLRRTFDSLLD